MIMNFIQGLILIRLFQMCLCFRSFQTQFNKQIFQRSCPSSHQYWPGIHPHMCAGTPRECGGTTQLRQVIIGEKEVMCHPQIQGYVLYGNGDTNLLLGWWPYVMIYSYDQNGNLIFTTEAKSSLYNNGCLIGQKYSGIYKCIYCSGYNYGQNCATSPSAPKCGQYCLTCDTTNQFCATCKDGQSPLDSSDLKCTLTCQAGHKACQQDESGYQFTGCIAGYELLNEQCVECPSNCKVCSQGVCSQCMWPYTLKNSLCFEDRNCMKYNFVYDLEGMPIDTDCLQCDVGYFKKGTRCSSCQEEPGLEKCFICHNSYECVGCFGTHYLTPDKKCALYTQQCNLPCQTCLVTDPDYCTSCFYQNRLSARVVPGKCVCDSIGGYAELKGSCLLCKSGDCETCTQTFGECLSCDPLRNRGLIGNTCPCLQGYYDTGLEDKICQKCYPSCYNCSGPFENDCTECGDPNIYYKQLVAGKCICAIRTIELVQQNGQTLCQPCHRICEKCQIPYDNSTNQYCTMCIAGQNRVLSDDLKCVCRSGYGEDGISDICFKCHYTCSNCNGPLSTNCVTCSSESNRHLTSNNECQCNQTFYDNGKNDIVCYLGCHNSCLDCNNPGEDQCISCPSTRQPDRIGSTFQCLCKDSHYYSDQYQLECLECHLTCKTCNGILDTSCLTCDLNYRQLIINRCDCLYGYYDVGQLQCQQCHYTCMTCFGPEIDNCITCYTQSNRIVKANKCACKDGHLEKQVGDLNCVKCSYRCASCSGTIDNCDKCPDFSYRDLGVDHSCQCQAQSYDQLDNPICIICHNTCSTCIGNLSNQCSSCNLLSGRELNDKGECLCGDKYYDNGQLECQACGSTCSGCKISPDNCTSCQPEKYLSGNICLCKTKLQGILVSTYQIINKLKCQACHYSCLTCSGPSSQDCINCWDQDNRIQKGTTCICISHYFDVGKPKCSQCNYRCENCAVLDTLCLTCPPLSLRGLINSQCLCIEGYYDDGINPICQKCHYSCQACTQIATRCTKCSISQKRSLNSILNQCICNDNYYDAGVEICQLCHYSCFNCIGLQFNQCKTCVNSNTSFRIYNDGICQCMMGYYDDGASSNCKQCSIQCLTCLNQSYYCTSCESTRHLNVNKCDCDQHYYETGQQKCGKCDQNCVNCKNNPTNCIDCDFTQFRILDNQNHKCICQDGTTEINGICQKCDISCQTCINSTTNCSSCGLMKQLLNNKCECVQGTYQTGTNKECKFCNQTCQTCINTENYCLTCSADNYRIFKTGNQCVCQDGYFEDSSQKCIQCDISCLTCQGNSKFCLSCDLTLSLQLTNQNKCICASNYYLNTLNKQCEVCNITCKECQTKLECIECEPLTRQLDPNTYKCLCKDGFYEINQKQCQICDLTCKTCLNQSTKCQTCESIYFRILNNSNKCPCQEGYFDVGIEMCQKCNNICKTCEISSTKCLSCYETQQIRILNGNQCVCKPGYFENGQLICEQCSKSCLTCQGKKDYCTSCDINQNRIDQSVIHKCPCLSDFFQDEDEICKKCHIKCSGCIQSKDNCISCKTSNTSNRLTITQNCNCKDGYFDDEIQFQCQKCNYQCKTCIQKSTNCLTCFSNLREGTPACNCKAGYFENEQQACESCQNQCSTCDIQSSNCTSCKGGRINKTCDCQDGYFEAGQPECVSCDFQCQTCEANQSYCLVCRGDRINNPTCNCQDGYYDDYQSINCIKCESNCKTCNQEGCLECNGNRLISEEKTCDCPLNSISHLDTFWCSNCEVAVMDIRLSDDLLGIIIQFDFSINPNYFYSQFQENFCIKFLADQTIKLLGNSPKCILNEENDKQLIVQLGSNALILPGDLFYFLNNSFGHVECQSKLNKFIFNKVDFPLNPVSPIIEYEIPQYLLNPCDDNFILVKSKQNDGIRSLISISWTYLVEGENGNGDLEAFVQDQTNLQLLDLIIPIQTLPKQSKIILIVDFQNFMKKSAQQQIKVETHSGQFPTVLWQGKKQYYTFELIDLLFKIKKKDCSGQSELQNDNTQYSVQIVEISRNTSYSRSSRVDYSAKIRQNYFNFTIQTFILTPRTAYTFQMVTLEPQLNFSTSQNVTIEIQQGGLLCQFNGTNKIQNYRKDSIINIQCRDLDTQYEWNEDPDITTEVSCADLTLDSVCKDVNNKIIQLNKTDTIQILPKATIKPYCIQAWTIIASKYQKSYQFKMNIVFLDNDFTILDVQYSKGYTIRPINNYETLQFQFNIPFENRHNLLQYQIAIIYNFELIKILEPQYFKYQFRLFDHFQQFQMGNQFNLKFLAQFTNDIIPSQSDLQLTLNQPPICSSVNLGSQNIQALKSQKIVANCELSDDSPFTYQLRFFLSDQDYKDFNNKLSDYSLILQTFQRSNSFELYLPQGEVVTLIQVMDSRGSITDLKQNLNVTQYQFNCSDFQYKNLNNKQQSILLLEVLINHNNQSECVQLSEYLIENIKSYLDSEDLNEQILILQTIKIYKHLILNLNNRNSSQRLLTEIKKESCYDNQTKSIYINNNQTEKYLTKDIHTFVQDALKLKNYAKTLFMKQASLENQINENDLFMDEQLFQQKESIINSLEVVILLVDDLFLKIQQTQLKSNEDKMQIFDLSEQLINLIDDVSTYLAAQVQVNGQSFTLNGQVLQVHLAKITKNVFNLQVGIEQDLMDGLIAFIQKEQLSIYFNYLNASENHLTELKTFLNQSILEIDKDLYIRTKLSNYLYKNQYINLQTFKSDYIVDMIQYPYCVDTQFQMPAFKFQCIQYNNNGSIQLCNLLIQEANNQNKSIQISCQCSNLGAIFLTRYQNLSENKLEVEEIQKINEQNEIDCTQTNSPFLLFHGIYVVFSIFLFFEFSKLEYSSTIGIEFLSNNSNNLKKNTEKWFKFSPSNLKVYQFSIKFIHEIICLFYCDDQIIRKSYKFLKMSIFLSILIPLSFFETFFIKTVTLITIFILNYSILLLLRMIFKICEAIYRFQGTQKVVIIIFYFLIHLFSYIIFFQQQYRKECYQDQNQYMLIIIGCTVFLNYVILDPIIIYIRVVLYIYIMKIMKGDEFNSFNQFLYFFIQHYKLAQIFVQ